MEKLVSPSSFPLLVAVLRIRFESGVVGAFEMEGKWRVGLFCLFPPPPLRKIIAPDGITVTSKLPRRGKPRGSRTTTGRHFRYSTLSNDIILPRNSIDLHNLIRIPNHDYSIASSIAPAFTSFSATPLTLPSLVQP